MCIIIKCLHFSGIPQPFPAPAAKDYLQSYSNHSLNKSRTNKLCSNAVSLAETHESGLYLRTLGARLK